MATCREGGGSVASAGPGGGAAVGAVDAAGPVATILGWDAARAVAYVFLLVAGSTTEAVWPLGCPVRHRIYPKLPFTKWQPAVSSSTLLARSLSMACMRALRAFESANLVSRI